MPKIIHPILTFFIHCLRLGSQGVHETQISVALKKVREPLSYAVVTRPMFGKPCLRALHFSRVLPDLLVVVLGSSSSIFRKLDVIVNSDFR